ncbi:MAG: hypothetical protein AAF589_08255, partial [Planctomycetota bacterium]
MHRVFSSLAAIAVLAAISTSAEARNPQAGLYWLTGEIRGESAILAAQAEQLLADCRDYDDVADELEDLCRDLDKLERELRKPIR